MTAAKKRYKYYDRLVDFAFWAFLAQSIVPWLRMVGVTEFRFTGALSAISAVAFAATWLLVVFLILARFMRDEYAEGLWQRAGATIVKILTVVPVLLFVIAATFQDPFVEWLRTKAPVHVPAELGPANELAMISYAHGMIDVLFWTGAYQPFLFLCLYKWQRWRDG